MEDIMVVVEKLSKKGLKWLKKNYQKNWRIFCLNEEDKELLGFVDHFELVVLTPYFHDLAETSLRLLETELILICPIAEKISSVLEIDVSTALHRYLLKNHYIRRARAAKIKLLYNLDEFRAIYVDSRYITYEGFLNILPLSPKYRTFIFLCYEMFKSLHSLRNILKSGRKAVDLLLCLGPSAARNLQKLRDLLQVSDVEFSILDKPCTNVVCSSFQDSGPIPSKLHRYFPGIMRDCLRCLCVQHGSFVLRFVPVALRRKYSTQDLYDHFCPKVVLYANEYDIYQSIDYHQLKKNGVVVLNFMHSDKMPILRDALAEYDNFLVWGKYYADLFEKLRYRGKKITVVGNPVYDKINNYKVVNTELLSIRDSYKKIISVYTQPSYAYASVECHIQMMIDVCNYVRDRSDILVFVKHHHNEFNYPTADYDKIIGGLQNVKRCYREYELYDLIAVSDLVLTLYSTVGLEAILFRKNVMYLNYGRIKDFAPYALEGSAVEITDNTEFDNYVNDLLNGTIKLSHQNTINLHANALDGQATQHIYDNIAEYMQANQNFLI